MLKIISQPYPFNEKSISRNLIQSLYEGLFIAFFLGVLQPFGISEWHDPNKNFVLAGYGFITTIAGLILRLGVFRVFPTVFKENKWTIGKEIGSIMLLILMITAGNCFYSFVVFDVNEDTSSFFWMLVAVMTIGVFPTVFGVMLNYIYQLKKHNQTIVVASLPVLDNGDLLKLTADNDKDTITMQAVDLLYIESADNYSTVYFLKNNILQKNLIRSSLTRLEAQIENDKIVRCHRSFIVNLNKVEKISGNAQGFKLHLQHTAELVPVARKYAEIVEPFKI